MKLEHDLIRDVLLFVENHCVSNTDTNGTEVFVNNPINWKVIYEDDTLDCKYDIDDIKYCIVVLYEAGMFEARHTEARGGYRNITIRDLSWQGRTFIENISDPKLWAKVKSSLHGVTRISLNAIVGAASQVATQFALTKIFH